MFKKLILAAAVGMGLAAGTASAQPDKSEVQKLFDAFHELVTSDPQREPDVGAVGKLAALAGVREYPVRVKCATLAWHTLRAALAGGGGATVKTE